jgi:uncharacterized MnhB-related membrane protein
MISLVMMLLFMVLTVVSRDLLLAVIFSGVESLVLAFAYFLLQAPDISLAQIAISAGIRNLLFIGALHWTRRFEE